MDDKEKSLENLCQMFECDVTNIREYIMSMRLNLALKKCEQVIKNIERLRRREKHDNRMGQN